MRLSKHQLDRKLSQALQTQLDRWQLFAPCLGANVTIADSLLGVWDAASGYREPDTKAPMPVGGQFYVYSITKTFTAIRILQLAEGGAVNLDAPISAYLSNLPFPPSVTLRRLLNHTGGVPSYTDLPEYRPANRANPDRPWSDEYVMSLTCTGKLDFEPGAGWHYSNTGYLLLRKLIESVTGQSFAKNTQEHVVKPLGLKATYVAERGDTGALVPGFCRSLNEDERMENVIPRYHPGWCLTGLVVSTTQETAKVYRSLFSGALLRERSLIEMRTCVPTGNDGGAFFKKSAYGLGLMVDPEWGFGGLFGHGGDGPGYNTWAMHLPDFHGRSVTLAVFCNTRLAPHPFYLVKDLLRVLKDT
jgi:D-alanyl-D-alanine carboxypeptidase